MAGNIFINYRRDVLGHLAGRLHDLLVPTFGRNKLFMDVLNIPVGRDFEDYLKSQVAACDVMLAIIGPNWLAGEGRNGATTAGQSGRLHRNRNRGSACPRHSSCSSASRWGADTKGERASIFLLKLLARRQAVQVRHTNFSSDAEALIAGFALDGTKCNIVTIAGRQVGIWV